MNRLTPFLLGLAGTSLLSLAPSQGVLWTQVKPTASPAGRVDHAMAYDAARQQVLLFGGYVGSTMGGTYSNGTWVWNGKTWRRLSPRSAPSARLGHAMAYDAARKQVVLFGGSGSTGDSAETWTWDGSTWTLKKPSFSPTKRGGHKMVYDPVSKRVVLFGGRSLNDTWLWDGKTWTRQNPSASPSKRFGATMAFDAVRKEILLFGGMVNRSNLSDTWIWNRKTWILQKPTRSPTARRSSMMAFDAVRRQLVLFGGYGSTSQLADTWTWDGTNWNKQSPTSSPLGRASAAMEYDAAHRQILLFGGQTKGPNYWPKETWLYWAPKFRGSFTAYGKGCGPTATGPVVTLSAASGSYPTIGKTFVAETKQAPNKSAFAIMSIGSSRTEIGTLLLPLNLGILGMPRCKLYTNYEFVWVFTLKNGSGQTGLPFPNNPSLFSTHIYIQSMAFATGANAAGILPSNGGELLIGNL